MLAVSDAPIPLRTQPTRTRQKCPRTPFLRSTTQFPHPRTHTKKPTPKLLQKKNPPIRTSLPQNHQKTQPGKPQSPSLPGTPEDLTPARRGFFCYPIGRSCSALGALPPAPVLDNGPDAVKGLEDPAPSRALTRNDPCNAPALDRGLVATWWVAVA